MRTFFEKVDASAQPGRNANPRCMISTFIALKKYMPKPLLTPAIDFYAATLLDNSRKIPRTESNEVQYQPKRRNVSTSSIERKIYTR